MNEPRQIDAPRTEPRPSPSIHDLREWAEEAAELGYSTVSVPPGSLLALLDRAAAPQPRDDLRAAHVECPTKMRDGKTYCACGNPWPCPERPDNVFLRGYEIGAADGATELRTDLFAQVAAIRDHIPSTDLTALAVIGDVLSIIEKED